MASKLSDDVDSLLLRYLHLADQYTQLREELNVAQASFHQNLSRANQASDRGIARYGKDRYDGRMQASRVLRISTSDSGSELESESSTAVPASTLKLETVLEGGSDPVRMFAVLPPPTLRAAQENAVKLVDVVPRLIEVGGEMREVEIRVRRARKYRAKEEKVEQDGNGMEKNLHHFKDVGTAGVA